MTPALNREVLLLTDAAAIARRAAEEFIKSVKDAISQHGVFNIALAGGSTPKALYSLLADDSSLRSQVAWDKVHFFFGDERHAGPDDADSNYRMARESMLSKLKLGPDQVTRIKGEYPDTQKAAAEYAGDLQSYFKLKPGEFPRFDLLLLGMGSEGHTASLFPGTKALAIRDRIATPNWIGKLYTERITLTVPALNESLRVLFMVTHKDKALALKAVLEGPYEPEQLPAQYIQPRDGSVLWLVDTEAGSLLTRAKHE